MSTSTWVSRSVWRGLSCVVVCLVLTSSPAHAAKKAKSKKAAAAAVDAGAPVAGATPAAAAPAAPAAKIDDLPDADKVCKKELETLCLGTMPGGGRVAKCVRANKDKASKECTTALYSFLKSRFQEACKADMEKHCKVESTKAGALMPCMKANADKLGAECKDVLGLSPPPAPAAAPAAAPVKK